MEKLTLFPNKGLNLALINIGTEVFGTGESEYPKVNPTVSIISVYKAGNTPPGGKAFKMSSNENPLGASSKVAHKVAHKVATAHIALERYPDSTQSKIKAQVAKAHGLKTENLVFGNGSDEFFHLVCSIFLARGDESIICEHGFLLYRSQIYASGAIPVTVRETNGKIEIQNIVKAINERTKLVFITVPANPAGTFLTLRELHILRDVLPTRIALLIDSAYAEYVVDDRYNDGRAIYRKNIIITRTFSKIYGLASIRVGWMQADREYIDAANRVRSPFNVSSIAQAAGAAAINDTAHRSLSMKFNLFWITKITCSLKQNQMLLNYSAANFVTIKAPKKVPIGLIEDYLAGNGIVTRDVSDYKLSNSLRASLGVSLANALLIKSLDNMNSIKIKKVVKVVRNKPLASTTKWSYCKTSRSQTITKTTGLKTC
ncbi:histidinol-phosphate transaminase [Candidatus Hodgkinia cicadicola]